MDANGIVRLAFARLGFGVDGAAITAEQFALGETLLRSLFANLDGVPHFTLAEVPEAARIPLADALAVELSPSFPGVPAPMSRASAAIRLLAVIRPDDRPIAPEVTVI
jgi:hypothetical protein